MKSWMSVVALLLLCSIVQAEDAPKHIALAPRSTIHRQTLIDWMDKAKKCSDVILETDESKADYLLEVIVMGDAIFSENTTTEYRLMSPKGDVLFQTSIRHYKSAMKDVCNYIESGQKKK